MPAMPDDWNEATLSWGDVPNLAPLDEDATVNATRSNFIRCVPVRLRSLSMGNPGTASMWQPAGAYNAAFTGATELDVAVPEGVPNRT